MRGTIHEGYDPWGVQSMRGTIHEGYDPDTRAANPKLGSPALRALNGIGRGG